MDGYVDRVASYDEDDHATADDDDGSGGDSTQHRHTQFLDLTNGKGGSFDFESDDDEEETSPSGASAAAAGGARSSAATIDAATASSSRIVGLDPSTPARVVETGQEHTGRWTREEHAAFLSALKMYGKEWKKVAAKVKTRTVVQTRTHAQKYFQKLHKAMEGDDNNRSISHVDMGVTVEQKKASAQRKKKAAAAFKATAPVRSQSTASTHAAAHVMTNLSSAPMSAGVASYATASSAFGNAPETAGFGTLAPVSAPSSMASATSTGFGGAHGFSSGLANNHDQPLSLPAQVLPSMGFFSSGMSIVAPEPQQARLHRWPEPSPAASGKRKLAELAAAQMLAGVAAAGGESTTPPPPEPEIPPPRLPTLQIVNPETLGISHEAKRNHSSGDSPTTPWDGQLEALVSEKRLMEDSKSSQDEDALDDTKQSGNGSGWMHPICGPGTSFGRSFLHEAVCDMNVQKINQELSRDVLRKRDEAGFCPLHTAAALTLIYASYANIACEISQLLVRYGADVCDVDSNGNTPLHWAARAGNEQVARFLLLSNCPPDAQNEAGETALHWAMRAGRRGMSVVCLLLDNGALASVVNNDFKRPMDVAVGGFPDDNPLKSERERKANKSLRRKLKEEEYEEKRQVRANLFARSGQSRTLVLYHPECLEHVPKSEADWECPDRVNAIMRRIVPEDFEAMEPSGIFAQEVSVSSDFDRANLDLLSRVHSAEYLAFVNQLSKDLEKQRKEGMKSGEDEPEGVRQYPAAVPFTPMVQRTVLKEEDFRNIKQADHSDTSFSAGSLRAARRAAGAVQHAVDCVLVGRNRNAFCVVRPPGHHAGIQGLLAGGESCGFCIFNNVAAGALHAISDERAMCNRCAIVDLDVHHGNGTEEIVKRCQDPGRLLFFSIHLYDHEKSKIGRGSSPGFSYKFYPGTGEADDLPHNIINVPITPLWRQQTTIPKDSPAAPQNKHNTRQKVKLKTSATNSPREFMSGDESSSLAEYGRTSDTESETASRISRKSSTPESSPRYVNSGRYAYRRAIQDRLLPALRAFNPDLILISAGFDAAKGDVGNARHYIGGTQCIGMDLEPEDYAWTTRKILEIADICCHGRVVSVLEGGYGRAPVSTDGAPKLLDKTVFAECAIRHLQAMIDPYDLEVRFSAGS